MTLRIVYWVTVGILAVAGATFGVVSMVLIILAGWGIWHIRGVIKNHRSNDDPDDNPDEWWRHPRE